MDMKIRRFADMTDSGNKFVSYAHMMDADLQNLMGRINKMTWDSTARESFNDAAIRLNNAYTDLKSILLELGKNVVTVSEETEGAEKKMANAWHGGGSKVG
jgi:uncharacterized protein YukE